MESHRFNSHSFFNETLTKTSISLSENGGYIGQPWAQRLVVKAHLVSLQANNHLKVKSYPSPSLLNPAPSVGMH